MSMGTWCVLHFLGKPLLRFYDLRNEVSTKLAEYGNIKAQWKALPDAPTTLEQLDLPPVHQNRLAEAQSIFRQLGSAMKAFAENQSMAVQILQWLGYDPLKASEGLIGYSNSIDTYGVGRHHFHQVIRTALRFPEG
jgi:hypothetical protein